MSFLDYAQFTIGICDSLQNCKLGPASVYKIKTEANSLFNFLRHCLELHLSPVNKKKLITRSHQILIFMKVTLFFLHQTNFGSQTYDATNLFFLKNLQRILCIHFV